MKYLILYILLLSGICGFGQCLEKDIELLETECAVNLGKYEYADSFTLRGKQFTYGGEKIEYKKNFYKGTTYLIVLKDRSSENNKLMVEIFDSSKRLVASSYVKATDKFYNKIFFPCKATGSYYLKYSFNENKPTCGASVIGFNTKSELNKKE